MIFDSSVGVGIGFCSGSALDTAGRIGDSGSYITGFATGRDDKGRLACGVVGARTGCSGALMSTFPGCRRGSVCFFGVVSVVFGSCSVCAGAGKGNPSVLDGSIGSSGLT